MSSVSRRAFDPRGSGHCHPAVLAAAVGGVLDVGPGVPRIGAPLLASPRSIGYAVLRLTLAQGVAFPGSNAGVGQWP
jgi:hypothetical protein